MADRVMLLNRGRIEQFAAPLELYDHPASTFVASFVGTPPMNLVDGEALANQTITALGTVFGYDGRGRGAVTLGLRPEQIKLATTDTAQFSGRLLSSENTGDRLNLVLDVAGLEIRVSLNERHQMVPGDLVPFKIESDKLHVFDRATGVRVS